MRDPGIRRFLAEAAVPDTSCSDEGGRCMKTMNAAFLFAISLATAAWAQENPYLEIPMAGRFGEQLTVRGMEDALKAAHRLGARHVVLTIASPGGDLLVAQQIYGLLSSHDRAFQFHAIVRRA